MFDLELMRRLSVTAAVSEAEVDQLRQNREARDEGRSSFESLDVPSAESANLDDKDVAALISANARDLVIGFEVGSRQLYEKKYIEPEWPKGQSGVTIGIGYDIGYHTADELKQNWANLLPSSDIERLLKAVSAKGSAAAAMIEDFRDIRVPWDAAIAAFERSTMPKYGRLVLKAFPHASDLKGNAFGALFSLVFNRGASMEGDRRQQMRNIRDACKIPHFQTIPQEIRDMQKLWEGQGLTGLIKRREAEACLFESGLEQMRVAGLPAGTLQPESVTDRAVFDGDGLYADEDETDLIGRESGPLWNDVKWPDNDDDAPDYQHISDRALSKKTFEFDGQALELLIRANAFEPLRNHGRIIFALRGAELVTSLVSPEPMPRQLDRPSLTLRDCRPNHKNFRCVIGVYDLTTARLSGFASSTVPNRGAVAGYYANHDAGNMMPTGRYRFEVNWHLVSHPERKIPGCLVEAGRQKCIHRSINNMFYDLEDVWENNRLHGDNLHPAKSAQSAEFSSLGCLVVSGGYDCPDGPRENGTHTGEWAQFRKMLGLNKPGTGDHGLEFDVILLTGLEAAISSDICKSGKQSNQALIQEKLGRIRQGSQGEHVKRLQRGLGIAETGAFTHDVVKAWTDRQQRDFAGKAQGTFGPVGDAFYKFGVFAPALDVVAMNMSGRAAAPGPVAGNNEPAQLEQLYYDIGLHAEATRRNPSANTSTLESLSDTNLEGINLEFGFGALQAQGAELVRTFERQLHQKICANQSSAMIDSNELRGKLDLAAKAGAGSLQKYVAQLIALFIPAAALFPPKLNETIADAIIAIILKPVAGSVVAVVGDQVELSAKWLCERWCTRLGPPDGVAAAPAKPPGPPVSGATGEKLPPTSPTASVSMAFADSGRVPQLLSNIEQSAKASSFDAAGVRRYVRDLRAHLDKSGERLNEGDTSRLLAALCDSRFMEQLSGVVADPYVLMRDIEGALNKTPKDKAVARKLLAELHAMLSDARLKMQAAEVRRLLKVLRGAKMFDEMAWIADRFAARDPELMGIVTTSYAQGLIDSGRLIAGIEVLHAAEEHKNLSSDEAKDAAGILGRAHKQIYVNHIKTPSDAIALRDSFGGQLSKAVECYGRYFDPQRPGENWYQGINHVALLKRAERDRIQVQGKGDAESMARAMIAALEPKALPSVEDPWLLATVGEAYLALGRNDKAAEFMSLYAKHPGVDAFALNGTVRQLEEIWQLKAGSDGAGAILTNLKGALAQSENGFVSLASDERRVIAAAGTVEFQQFFETMTSNGKYINFGLLKQIVARGSSVAAIQLKIGQMGRTIGTGFLVKGSDFSPSLSNTKSYVLTNAHVIWARDFEPTRNQGAEDKALAPEMARVVFENDQIDGRMEYYGCKVVWQSPSSQLDATLVELDHFVDHAQPLEVAPATCALVVANETTKGTKLAVLGHPLGGSLSIGVLGSLEEMQGTLIDRGPHASTVDPEFLHYLTPTEPGNSGSPVFEAEGWRVVGLHHAGFPDGGRPKLGGKAGTQLANEGIWIESIRAAVKQALAPEPMRGGRRKWWG